MVNPKLMEMAKRLGQGITPATVEKPKPIENTSLDKKTVCLAMKPADKMTQDKAIAYWNSIQDGRFMASMADLYHSFKDLRKFYEKDSPSAQMYAKEVTKNLRNAMDWSKKENWVLSSTRIEYNPHDLNTKIIHHYDCQYEIRTKETIMEVPIYRGALLADVLNTPQGLRYMQVLFSTDDDAKTIIPTLEYINGKTSNRITVHTQDKENRKKYPIVIAGFTGGADGVAVNGLINLVLNYKGFSYGVNHYGL